MYSHGSPACSAYRQTPPADHPWGGRGPQNHMIHVINSCTSTYSPDMSFQQFPAHTYRHHLSTTIMPTTRMGRPSWAMLDTYTHIYYQLHISQYSQYFLRYPQDPRHWLFLSSATKETAVANILLRFQVSVNHSDSDPGTSHCPCGTWRLSICGRPSSECRDALTAYIVPKGPGSSGRLILPSPLSPPHPKCPGLCIGIYNCVLMTRSS